MGQTNAKFNSSSTGESIERLAAELNWELVGAKFDKFLGSTSPRHNNVNTMEAS